LRYDAFIRQLEHFSPLRESGRKEEGREGERQRESRVESGGKEGRKWRE